MTVVWEEMTETFGVRAGRPGLEDLVLPEHFRDPHGWLVVRCRVGMWVTRRTVTDSREERSAAEGRRTNRGKQQDSGLATWGPIRSFLND